MTPRVEMHESRYGCTLRFRMSNRMSKRQPSHVLFRRLNRRLREARDFQVRNHIGEIGLHHACRTGYRVREFDRNPQTSLRVSEYVLVVHRLVLRDNCARTARGHAGAAPLLFTNSTGIVR